MSATFGDFSMSKTTPERVSTQRERQQVDACERQVRLQLDQLLDSLRLFDRGHIGEHAGPRQQKADELLVACVEDDLDLLRAAIFNLTDQVQRVIGDSRSGTLGERGGQPVDLGSKEADGALLECGHADQDLDLVPAKYRPLVALLEGYAHGECVRRGVVKQSHDSPSVETPAAASTAAGVVEDTVGGRADTAAGPPAAAVSAPRVHIEHFGPGPSPFEVRVLELLEEIADRSRPVILRGIRIDLPGMPAEARERSSKDRHAGKSRRARD